MHENDKAGSAYWDMSWNSSPAPFAVNPHALGLNNTVTRYLHQFFRRVFEQHQLAGSALVEMGCGASAWLPYFANEFGCRVSGLDYSATGCIRAAEVMRNSGVDGEIIQADFLSRRSDLLGKFDVVFSFGVVEHYKETARCVGALSEYLRPGGLMITLVPNMCGLPGLLQRMIDRAVYEIHVPLDREALCRAHQDAGMEIVQSQYLMSLNLSAINAQSHRGTSTFHLIVRAHSWLSKAVWMWESVLPAFPRNRWTSPYVACVARAPSYE